MSAWFLVPVALLLTWIVLALLHDMDQYFRIGRRMRRLDAEDVFRRSHRQTRFWSLDK
jgi:hypothetical protein